VKTSVVVGAGVAGDDPGSSSRRTVLLEIKRPFGGEVKVERVFDPVAADAPAPPPRAEGAP
jgi:hypothetical protein